MGGTPPHQIPYLVRRFAARVIDFVSYGIVLTALGMTAILPDEAANYLLLFALYFFIYEPLFMVVYGTTPGKFLLGLKVEKTDGRRLTAPENVRRSGYIWFYGYGVGIPATTFIALAQSLVKASKNQPLKWDAKIGTKVLAKDYSKLSLVLRCLMVFVILVAMPVFFSDM